MDNQLSTSESILPERVKTNSKRRESIFETETTNTDANLEEWDRVWGKHNTNYVNVLKYPEHCIKELEEEIENTSEACKVIYNKYEEFEREADKQTIIAECQLSTDKKALLHDIDSRISKLVEKCAKSLKSLEVDAIMHEYRLKQFKQETKIRKAMLLSSMFNNK